MCVKLSITKYIQELVQYTQLCIKRLWLWDPTSFKFLLTMLDRPACTTGHPSPINKIAKMSFQTFIRLQLTEQNTYHKHALLLSIFCSVTSQSYEPSLLLYPMKKFPAGLTMNNKQSELIHVELNQHHFYGFVVNSFFSWNLRYFNLTSNNCSVCISLKRFNYGKAVHTITCR